MKRFLLLHLLLLTPLVFYGQVSFGSPERLNDGWLFTLSDPQGAKQAEYEVDRHWRPVDLPHDWSVKGTLSPTLASATGYLPGGIGWYRKTLSVPAEKAGEKVYLYFEGVYNRSSVYINGQLVGERPNGYISFLYDATPYIEYGAENVIAVRVDHSRSADSRWYTGSGIYRDVWLVYSSPVHIAQWGVYAYPDQVDTRRAVLKIETEIENGSPRNASLTVVNELFTPEGVSVGKKSTQLAVGAGENQTLKTEIIVRNPMLWSLESPTLYTLKTTVLQAGKKIDESSIRTGLRHFAFDPDKGFALNGQAIKMKGVCIHHDAGVLGSAVPKEVWHRRLQTLKELGCNAIRTSHNPQAPALYDLADELGFLVMDEAYDEWEFPKRKWLEGWNVGTPGLEGSYDFFAEWGERDLADLVRRDRNHPSIFAWSIGNEVDYPNDPYSHPVLGGANAGGFTQAIYGGYRPDSPDANRLGGIAKRLVAVVKQYDRSRPTTAGLAGVAMSNETEYPAALDIAGYNYTENRYAQDHAKYPDRVIYGSENRHEKAMWDAVAKNDFIFGQFLWTGIDYLGESGRWPTRGFYSGLLDFGGFVKPRGYFRKALWSSEPTAYLGTYPTPERGSRIRGGSQADLAMGANDGERMPSMDAWPIWNYREGQSIRVVCYTNARQAELLLNGEPVGEIKPYDETTGIIWWDIPFRPGTLEVRGLDESGREVSRDAIRTSGRPHALRIVQAENTISKERGVAQIVLQVVDAEGIPVMLSDDELTCQITGPARLLGLEAGNNTDMSDYTDAVHRVYHGRMLAYVQAAGEAGEIQVRFTAPWLEPAECTIRIE